METNTVILSVEEYNKLRDFKINIEKGNTYSILRNMYSVYDNFITTDEAVKEVLKINKELAENQIQNVDTINGKNILDVSKMSIWEFIKWKNK